MIKYLRIEDMHPKIKAFFESVGELKLDDEKNPHICLLRPNNGEPGHSIAITVSELKWLDFGTRTYAHLWEDPYRQHDKWLYWGVDKWVKEEEMLKIIKLKAFL